ncbi:MAG: pilus assembly protein [Planctomycetaceae bacterium]|nr:pilus assembly protein [Planctomycetaceae bacterium]
MTPRPAVRDQKRRGVAAAEFAVCLPVLVLVVFASIEACTMIFLKESLTVAAYEGSRVVFQSSATDADVIARCQEVLAERSVDGATVEVLPADFGTIAAGEPIEIRVSAPCASNAVIPVWFYGGTTMTGSSIVMSEY